MKIALIGYGKMGQEIEKLAIRRGHTIVLTIDNQKEWEDSTSLLSSVEMAMEFSTPDSALENIYHCFDANIPVVTGTTGCLENQEQIRRDCMNRQQALLYSPNFSIGVNLFFELNRFLARLMSKCEGYDISIEETHHIHKKDAPSGTAIVLANDIIQINEKKEKWVKEFSDRPDELGIQSFRTENVPGLHLIKYESDDDFIEIRHNAKNRKGFAMGAIMAAEWLAGKTGYYQMQDFLESIKK